MACGLACFAMTASSCFQAVQAMHCHGCCASTCRRMHSLQTLAASARFHRPAVNAEDGFDPFITFFALSFVSVFCSQRAPIQFFTTPEPQQQFSPYFCALLKRCCREGSVHKQTMPVLDTRQPLTQCTPSVGRPCRRCACP